MSDPTIPSLASYAAPFGGCFVTFCVSFILYGVTTIQAYSCLRKYPKDSIWTKMVVMSAWFIETVHTAFCIEFTYQYLIIGYGDPFVLARIPWSIGVLMITTLVIIVIVHFFFIHRVWVLSNKCIFAVVIPIIMVIVNIGFDLAITALLYKYETWKSFHAHKGSIMTVTVASVLLVVIDVILTTTLIYYLHKRRTGYATTDRLVHRIEMYLVNSGAITVAASLSVLLTFALMSDNLLYAGLEQILCKLYNNALLASLNSREVHNGRPGNSTSSEQGRCPDPAPHSGSSPRRQYNIHIAQPLDSDVESSSGPPTELKDMSLEKIEVASPVGAYQAVV